MGHAGPKMWALAGKKSAPKVCERRGDTIANTMNAPRPTGSTKDQSRMQASPAKDDSVRMLTVWVQVSIIAGPLSLGMTLAPLTGSEAKPCHKAAHKAVADDFRQSVRRVLPTPDRRSRWILQLTDNSSVIVDTVRFESKVLHEGHASNAAAKCKRTSLTRSAWNDRAWLLHITNFPKRLAARV
jgi:hypothetical protein